MASFKKIIRHKIGGRIKRFCFKIYESFFPKFEIDELLIQKVIADFDLNEMTKKLEQGYHSLYFDKKDNTEYFGNILNYMKKGRHLSDNPFFLYPPNVAVIDFLLKNVEKNDLILDYSCGLCNLLLYLKKLGFKNARGYDNYSQISFKTVRNFLDKFSAVDIILSKEEVFSFRTKIISCISFFWDRLDKDLLLKEAQNRNLKYILIDYDYAPRIMKDFRIKGIYNKLLIVFEKKK